MNLINQKVLRTVITMSLLLKENYYILLIYLGVVWEYENHDNITKAGGLLKAQAALTRS